MKVGEEVLYELCFVAAAEVSGNAEVLAKFDGRRSIPAVAVGAVVGTVDIAS